MPLAMTRIGILHRPHIARAEALAYSIQSRLTELGVASWTGSAWNETQATEHLHDTDLLVGIGGDGTILHCARISAKSGIPVFGVKLGQLGFITECTESEALILLPRVVNGEGWSEERAMLSVTLHGEEMLALNDAVVRCTAVRLIDITLEVGQQQVTNYRADGVIIASATGSTAYSLAAGGPVLMPESTNMVVQPICSHLGLRHAIVLPGQSSIALSANRHDGVVLSLDGQIERPLSRGEPVSVTISEHKAHFLRLRPRSYFLRSLHEKLGGTYT